MIPINEQPYSLPVGWQWVKMETIATIFTGNSINERIKAEKYFGSLNIEAENGIFQVTVLLQGN